MKKLSEIVSYFDKYENELNNNSNTVFSMTDEQKNIVDTVLREYKTSKNFAVLDSASGTGKSFTIKQLIKECEKRKISYAVTATTGKASSALGGVTIHSYIGLKMIQNDEAEVAEDALKLSDATKIDNKVDILIIDEFSMAGYGLYNTIKKCNFNYILVALDSSQLPPVKDKAVDYCSFPCTQFKLTKTMRARDKDMLKLFDDFKLYRDGNIDSLNLKDYVNGRNIIEIDYSDVDYLPANTESCSVAYRNKIVEDLVGKLTHKNHNMYNLNNGVGITRLVDKKNGNGKDFVNEQVFYNGEDVKIELLTNETQAIVKNGYCFYKNFKISLSKNKNGLSITDGNNGDMFYLKIPEDNIVEQCSLACIEDKYFIFLWDKSEDEYNEEVENAFLKLKPFLIPHREIKKFINGKDCNFDVVPKEIINLIDNSDSRDEFESMYEQSELFKNRNRGWVNFLNIKSVCSARATTSRTISKAQGISVPVIIVTNNSFYGASLAAQYVAVTRGKHCLVLVNNHPNIVKG